MYVQTYNANMYMKFKESYVGFPARFWRFNFVLFSVDSVALRLLCEEALCMIETLFVCDIVAHNGCYRIARYTPRSIAFNQSQVLTWHDDCMMIG